MKHRSLPLWATALLIIAAVLLVELPLYLHIITPITAESGEHFILRLKAIDTEDDSLRLDFGMAEDFHIPLEDGSSPLLQPDAIGREYEIIAELRTPLHMRSYYAVHALTGAGGTPYLTIAQSEARRQALLPQRLLPLAGLCAVVLCGYLCKKKITAALQHKEEPTHD